MLAIVAVFMGFIALTDYVSEGRADRFDKQVIDRLRRTSHPPLLVVVCEDITALGGPGSVMLACAMTTGYLLIERRYWAVAWLFCATTSGAAFTVFLKTTINRLPPGHPPGEWVSQYIPSFPSGHSMMSAVVYLTLAVILSQLVVRRMVKLYILVMAILVVFLVGMSRVYLCIHWPTDVLGGWAAGLVWALHCWVITTRLRQTHAKRRLAASASQPRVLS